MECYFASYSKERSIAFWQEKKATPVIQHHYDEDKYNGFSSDEYKAEYLEANLAVAEELKKLLPDILETILSIPPDPIWGRPSQILDAITNRDRNDTPTVDQFLVCKQYLNESQQLALSKLQTKRDELALKIRTDNQVAKMALSVKISKDDLLEIIETLDFGFNAVSTLGDISYHLLDHFINYFNLELDKKNNLPTKAEMLRLYESINSKAIQEISDLSHEEPKDLIDFLQKLKPVAIDLQSHSDSDFLLVGDDFQPESFETYLKNRSKEIFVDIEQHLPSNWTITK